MKSSHFTSWLLSPVQRNLLISCLATKLVRWSFSGEIIHGFFQIRIQIQIKQTLLKCTLTDSNRLSFCRLRHLGLGEFEDFNVIEVWRFERFEQKGIWIVALEFGVPHRPILYRPNSLSLFLSSGDHCHIKCVEVHEICRLEICGRFWLRDLNSRKLSESLPEAKCADIGEKVYVL